MTTPANPTTTTAKLAVIDPAGARLARQSQAVLEQMFAYFSFEPLPLEAAPRLAA